jgi:hypothetical protein
MKFSTNTLKVWLIAVTALSSTCDAFSPSTPPSNNVDPMAAYEAALKSLATSNIATTTPTKTDLTYNDVSLLQQLDQQKEAMDKYEAALRAALQNSSSSTSNTVSMTSSATTTDKADAIKQVLQTEQQKMDEQQCWSTLTEEIHTKIHEAQQQNKGKPLSEKAKDDIVATAIAGSVLGTAVGSPLLVGAALGYCGTQMIMNGENGDKTREFLQSTSRDLMTKAGEQANAALAFTQQQLQEEHDLSDISKKIVKAIEAKANQVNKDIRNTPFNVMSSLKQTVESEELKTLPNRSFKALRDFIGSEEVKAVSRGALKAIKDGLESEEMKALQHRATEAVKDTLQSKK